MLTHYRHEILPATMQNVRSEIKYARIQTATKQISVGNTRHTPFRTLVEHYSIDHPQTVSIRYSLVRSFMTWFGHCINIHLKWTYTVMQAAEIIWVASWYLLANVRG